MSFFVSPSLSSPILRNQKTACIAVYILLMGLLTFVAVCIQNWLFLFVKKDVPNSTEVYENSRLF
jgi:hypothetical protein